MPVSASNTFRLLELYKERQVNQVSDFSDFARQLNLDELIDSYQQLKNAAPRRHARNLKYLVGHTGVTSSGAHSNRSEEHLAVALWNQCQASGPFQLARMGELLLQKLVQRIDAGCVGSPNVGIFGARVKSLKCYFGSSKEVFTLTPFIASANRFTLDET
jgi:hypothetical protein